MNDDAVILGSENPDADVLVYDKDKAYYQGKLQVRDNGTNYDLEFVNNGTTVPATFEYVK